MKIMKRSFPNSRICQVSGGGMKLTDDDKGIEAELHWRNGEENPCCAEVVSENHYAEIGLSFVGKELIDYDGVFSLPMEVATMLRDLGFVVPDYCV